MTTTIDTARGIDIDPTTGESRRSHLVAPERGRSGAAIALQARVDGTPVRTLCGRVLVPSRDPRSYPTCPRCLEIFKARTGADDGFRDA